MFSKELKSSISDTIQKVLQSTQHPELPKEGEIQFLLHVDGAEFWSWANIRNNNPKPMVIPESLIGNNTV